MRKYKWETSTTYNYSFSEDVRTRCDSLAKCHLKFKQQSLNLLPMPLKISGTLVATR